MTFSMRKFFSWACGLAALLLVSGCATQGMSTGDTNNASVQTCQAWYRALDSAVNQAGVRDAGTVPVPGFVQLRADRFHAALGQDLDALENSKNYADAWIKSLQQLDLQARGFEIKNMPDAQRRPLAKQALVQDAPQALLEHTQNCADQLTQRDVQSPQRMAQLQKSALVPDDYVTAYRVLGLYAISRYPFAAGVHRLEVERQAVFNAPSAEPAKLDGKTMVDQESPRRLRFVPPDPPSAQTPLRLEQVASMLAPSPQDPLHKPQPSLQALERLFALHAPVFDVEVANEDDKPGALYWPADPTQPLALDTNSPVLYTQTATTRYKGHNLLQLVYTLWFGARPRQSHARVDLLAGHLDGVVFRVTLAPDGSPLVYDSIHPCGCYHTFFPTPSATPKPAPQSGIEWAFSPQSLPALAPQERLVVRLDAVTHYVQRIAVEPLSARAGAQTKEAQYAWRDYDSLRSLAIPQSNGAGPAYRSAFTPDGFVAGTDRLESLFFWPMGIARAGTMRQWGRHPTAFVGRRHFDDATLMEQRFEFDARHFRPQSSLVAPN